MSDQRRNALAQYVRHLADRMGLKDWNVAVSLDTPDDPKHMAEADCTYGQKKVVISVCEAFFRRDEQDRRQTIVHELVHAHIAVMHKFLACKLDEGESYGTYNLLMEYAVDGIADGWAPLLPTQEEFEAKAPDGLTDITTSLDFVNKVQRYVDSKGERWISVEGRPIVREDEYKIDERPDTNLHTHYPFSKDRLFVAGVELKRNQRVHVGADGKLYPSNEADL